VLSGALNYAMRHEVVFRNVARLVDVPRYEPVRTQPWSSVQAVQFMAVAENHRWFIAYLMIFIYGLRLGEAIGLRWCDVDFDNNEVHVRQQIQRVNGHLVAGPPKTKTSVRVLPLAKDIRKRLLALSQEVVQSDCGTFTEADPGYTTCGTIITTTTGKPVDPCDLRRTFQLLCKKAGLPKSTLHSERHMAATLMKDLGVPLRDVQELLGHSDPTTTQKIYQHGTNSIKRAAIAGIEQFLKVAPGGSLGSKKAQLQPELQPDVVMNPKYAFVNGPNMALLPQNNTLVRPIGFEPTTFGTGSVFLVNLSYEHAIPQIVNRNPFPLLNSLPTTILSRLHSREHRRFCGLVATRTATGQANTPLVSLADEATIIRLVRQNCQAALTEKMRLMSFPFNLLSTTEHR